MKRLIKILAGCALLFLLGVGIGYLLRVPFQQGGGLRYQESPDKKWVAFASTLGEGSVVGFHRTYYEFTIQTPQPSPRIVRRLRVEDSDVPQIDWREDGSILWASNSSAVTFKADGYKTVVDVTLKIEP